jgi:hypothetical protein
MNHLKWPDFITAIRNLNIQTHSIIWILNSLEKV